MVKLRRPFAALASLALLPAAGCLDHPLKEVRTESVINCSETVPVDPRRKVDVLFVIDNSGSMGEEQATLAENFPVFMEALERVDVDADYRIGITTTDNGHPWCSGTTPEAGALQLRSCRAHLDDFVFGSGGAGEVDRREEACLAQCDEALADLRTAPSTTAMDDEPRARPWLERGHGRTNLPEGVTIAEAMACWGPQGINGCGYESPLESMRKALLRSGVDDEAGAGFVRDDALLLVVFITDEADCSLGEAGDLAFDPEGSRALWPDPEAPLPPSAVCWNAGVSCETQPDGRVHCEPADLDAEGQPTDEEGAVLRPVARYMELLDQIDAAKRARTGEDESQVLVSVIAGVPPGYDGQPLDHGPGSDPTFLETFGVGAGCSSERGEAVPPVRLAALADAFSGCPGCNLFSICSGDYTAPLQAIAETLIARIRPNCIDTGEQGSDAIVDGRVESCVITQTVEDEAQAVPTCVRASDGAWARPDDTSICAYGVSGDEIHQACADAGQQVELRFLRAPGASYGAVQVTCEGSVQPGAGCNIGVAD